MMQAAMMIATGRRTATATLLRASPATMTTAPQGLRCGLGGIRLLATGKRKNKRKGRRRDGAKGRDGTNGTNGANGGGGKGRQGGGLGGTGGGAAGTGGGGYNSVTENATGGSGREGETLLYSRDANLMRFMGMR